MDLRDRLKTWSTYLATGICGAVFLRLTLTEGAELGTVMESWGWRSAFDVWGGDWWALITTAFVHVHFLHFFFNAWWLLHLGKPLERALGPTRWWTLVVASAFVSSASQMAVSDGTGIGFSGVIYAFFGFMWVAKRRWVEFGKFVDKDTSRWLFGWLVACFFFTHFGIMNIGNAAHLAGLVFGGAVGVAVSLPARNALGASAAAMLLAAAVGVLFWAPWSLAWTEHKAITAQEGNELEEALGWYERCLDFDPEQVWVRYNIALILKERGETEEYVRALAALRALNAKAASELESEE
ncbi:MAG: rhomboid family intramembrane serine protease [Planctomycetota bacterium]|jgi:GlpG protein